MKVKKKRILLCVNQPSFSIADLISLSETLNEGMGFIVLLTLANLPPGRPFNVISLDPLSEPEYDQIISEMRKLKMKI